MNLSRLPGVTRLLSILQLTKKTMGLNSFTVLSVCLLILQGKGGRFVGNI